MRLPNNENGNQGINPNLRRKLRAGCEISKGEICRRDSVACPVSGDDRQNQEGPVFAAFERSKVIAGCHAATSQRSANTEEIRAGASFSSGGPNLAEVASAGGSGAEPALCQTPATTLTNQNSGRESVATSTPTQERVSRPSGELGGAEFQNAANNWLRGRGMSACGARRRSHRPVAANRLGCRNAASSRRSSPGRSVRCKTKNRARSRRVRSGWCGAVSHSGRATSVGRLAATCTLCETETSRNSVSPQVAEL